jgi:predicted MPP superfamily phosphohydrolase
MSMLTRRQVLRGGAAALAIGGGLAAYSVLIEPEFRLKIAQFGVAHPAWPATMPPLRIAVLTDIHAVEPWMPAGRIKRLADTANALGPDLIVLLGDYVASMPRFRSGIVPVRDWAAALSGLRAPLGVFSILGNHDWWTDNWAVRAGLQQVHIPVLENRAVKIDKGGRRFWIAGLGDQLGIHVRGGGYRGVDDLPGTLRQTMGDTDPVILLAHEPDIFVRVPDRVTVTLSGHTHGGQIRLPIIGRPVIPSRYGQRFAYGHIVEGGRNLVVSAGLGMTAVPVRFNVPPEIAIVTVGAPGSVEASA